MRNWWWTIPLVMFTVLMLIIGYDFLDRPTASQESTLLRMTLCNRDGVCTKGKWREAPSCAWPYQDAQMLALIEEQRAEGWMMSFECNKELPARTQQSIDFDQER